MKLYIDPNEYQSESRIMALDMALAYYKKDIESVEKSDLVCDLMLEHDGKKVMCEVKELNDFWGSVPPRGRLGRQVMDMALNSNYAYVGVMGSQDDLLQTVPDIYGNDKETLGEEILLRILGDIKSVGVVTLFLSKNPVMAYRTILKFAIHDLLDNPPLELLCKPIKDYPAINVLSNLPGIGWERAEEILKLYNNVYNFMHHAQKCLTNEDFGSLENIFINGRRLGKNARKIFEVEGIWQKKE